ncbi:RNA polymerase sigma factor [Pseudozobellia thermophila]|uniref:RNA polymerase sigma-70 factor, ECF subfamily n=1 Tax=Pseudozobellia thermophila TaxID=192903 RepID=A0A1M6F3B9_9FLAO|nr:RNA polymerase sigma-70 factor [Pseudozobellia thermophila]SHI92197.1 RNA polymerase sigma-70 factor, ECF subfamily [Pseudozobellia thermophila]
MNIDYNNNGILIQHLKNGQEKAYEYLVETYHHRLCVYANSLVNDKDQAEDIVQNVFIRTWERRYNLKPTFTIKSFLYKSVHNEFIDQYRKQKSVTALEKKYIEELERFSEKDEVFFERLLSIVQEEIQNLPPKCRKIFLMSKQEGFSNIEIAEHLNLSQKTIEYHITKAFAILRQKASRDLEPVLFLLFGFNKNRKMASPTA